MSGTRGRRVRLVDDLMDVSRIITGKLRLSTRSIPIAPVIELAADVIRPSADSKNIRLVLDLAADLGQATADADRLQQII